MPRAHVDERSIGGPAHGHRSQLLQGGRNDAPIVAIHVNRYGGHYVAVAKAFDPPSTNPDDNRVLAWTADGPSGPWTSIGEIREPPPPSAPGGWT